MEKINEKKDVVALLEEILKYEKSIANKRMTCEKNINEFCESHIFMTDDDKKYGFSIDVLESDYTNPARFKKMVALFDSIKALDKDFFSKIASNFKESFETMEGVNFSEVLKKQISDIGMKITFAKDSVSLCTLVRDVIEQIESEEDERKFLVYGLLVGTTNNVFKGDELRKDDEDFRILKAKIEKFLAKLIGNEDVSCFDVSEVEEVLSLTTFNGKPTVNEFEDALKKYLEERQRKAEESAKRVVVIPKADKREEKPKVSVAQSSKKYEKPYLNDDAHQLLESYIGMIEETEDLTRWNFPPDVELAHKGINFDEFMTGVLLEEKRKASLLCDFPNKYHENYAKILGFYAEHLIEQEEKTMSGNDVTREKVKTKLNEKK